MNTTWIDSVNILLVDDRPENLTALVSMLDRPGYRLLTARSGSEALKLVMTEVFAVILLDVMMPIMDGLEVASLIKKHERSRHTPIIFLTAAGMDLDRVLKAYSLGAVDYLLKPVAPEVVQAKVAVFVDLFRKTEEIKHQAALLREHDRREREQKLAELRAASDRRYRDLAEAIPQLVWRADAYGAVNYLSKRWHGYTGLGVDASTGWAWLAAIHPDDSEKLCTEWLEALKTGTSFQAECRVKSAADGSFRWHLCQALPETGERGEVIGWLGTYTDVDAQKRADEERLMLLRHAEHARAEAERLQRRWAILAEVSRLLNESLDSSVSLLNVARHLVATVSRGCIIEIIDEGDGVTPVAIVHQDPEEEARLRTAMQSPRREGRAPPDIEVPIEARGRVVGTLTLLELLPDVGRGADDIAFVNDVGHRIAMFVESKRLYGKAQRAIGARDEFLSIASHELRTPVTSLKIQVQLISRGLRGKGRVPLTMNDAAAKADVAERQINRLSTLIDALLDVSRIGTGQLILHVEEVDLCRVAREVATRLTDSRGVDSATIAVEAPAPVLGRWDPMRIEQIITNLLSNALKYGPGRPIKVGVWANGAAAVLTVKDHGIGIEKENLNRIFDRFERAVSPISYGGLGLGLYITRHIVRAHHGTIEVASELGAGTEFRVTLPLDAGEQAAEGDSTASAQI